MANIDTGDPIVEEFKRRADAMQSRASPPRLYGNDLDMLLVEWKSEASKGRVDDEIKSVAKIGSSGPVRVRIVLTHRDVPHPETVKGLTELFSRFAIPSTFLNESLRHVSQSFGTQTTADGTNFVWFHLLSLDIPKLSGDEAQLRKQKGPFYSDWVKPGFVLKLERCQTTPAQSCSTTSSTGISVPLSQTAPPQNHSCITLFCFGAPPTLGDRMKVLKGTATGSDLSKDPYALVDIVFEEMHQHMDKAAWGLATDFGKIETRTLELAPPYGVDVDEIDFTRLHVLAKNVLYLRENIDAAGCTLESLRNQHERLPSSGPVADKETLQQAFVYRKTMFESTQRRLASLDKRMANIIELSYHMVTMIDSRVIQSESKSMKTIAVMTLIFMPLGTVAAIFGTQLIRLKDEQPYQMEVSQDFWLLWAIAGPVTGIVYILWRVWYRAAKKRLVGKKQKKEGGRRYMGWKRLKERFARLKSESRGSIELTPV
ncbi:hypothetical protein BDV95DRAFT_601229 [Massariosphaeria phaeospora]|uniref:Uncharacterized protein n=1 Tax=Massariosphaeria phaeospora TaxID=100035 RepID=A0A7C8MHF2_9PLEO|nr:hypothetical protein BDV95DRAFT_601229 [Massariosphaeria phaeospora]